MRLIFTKREIDQRIRTGDFSPAFAEYLPAEWLELAQGVLGGDDPEEDEDLSECMTTIILQPGDEGTEIANLPYIPNSFAEGIPWDDASVVALGNGRFAYSGNAICSDWHILIVFQESDTVPDAFANWFSGPGVPR